VPAVLADGWLKRKPDPVVIGQGLDKLQAACDKYQEGVSAKKLVVELPEACLNGSGLNTDRSEPITPITSVDALLMGM
jgi:hypothetical protein